MNLQQKLKKNMFAVVAIGGIVLVGALLALNSYTTSPKVDLTAFAQCITDSGATFYGAFWCPHCQDQKKAFGKAQDALPYVECSTPDGQGQLQVYTDAEITSYPTWVFADGSTLSGLVPLVTLARKTNCELPA